MAKREMWYVAKMAFVHGGVSRSHGELIQPLGERNDLIMFGENTRWTYRFNGEALECGTDGCGRKFADERALADHRRAVHGPNRDYRERRGVEEAQERARMEAEGVTVGGHPVEKVVGGPRGPVPYIGR